MLRRRAVDLPKVPQLGSTWTQSTVKLLTWPSFPATEQPTACPMRTTNCRCCVMSYAHVESTALDRTGCKNSDTTRVTTAACRIPRKPAIEISSCACLAAQSDGSQKAGYRTHCTRVSAAPGSGDKASTARIPVAHWAANASRPDCQANIWGVAFAARWGQGPSGQAQHGRATQALPCTPRQAGRLRATGLARRARRLVPLRLPQRWQVTLLTSFAREFSYGAAGCRPGQGLGIPWASLGIPGHSEQPWAIPGPSLGGPNPNPGAGAPTRATEGATV